MKWLRLFFLLAVVVAVGCSQAPSGTAGDENDPALTTDLVGMDPEAEANATAEAEAVPAGEAKPEAEAVPAGEAKPEAPK